MQLPLPRRAQLSRHMLSWRILSRRFLSLPVLLGLALAGCTSTPDVVGCPKVGFVNDLDRVTVFQPGGGEDLTEVLFEVKLGQLTAFCDPGKKAMEVKTEFQLIASRGPADRERVANVEYFVAVVDPTGEIVAREAFGSSIPFADNRRRVGLREIVEPSIPNPPNRSFVGYRVLIGLQLTKQQLAYNRRHRR
jgi:hypothetical protein